MPARPRAGPLRRATVLDLLELRVRRSGRRRPRPPASPAPAAPTAGARAGRAPSAPPARAPPRGRGSRPRHGQREPDDDAPAGASTRAASRSARAGSSRWSSEVAEEHAVERPRRQRQVLARARARTRIPRVRTPRSGSIPTSSTLGQARARSWAAPAARSRHPARDRADRRTRRRGGRRTRSPTERLLAGSRVVGRSAVAPGAAPRAPQRSAT